jgi:NAD(P)-dependent dehydrogenase (short-subunit alcohol dehydrogenase family)
MKIEIVTGSSKGIGRAIALTFAKSKGYSGLVINGRKMDKVREEADEIRGEGCDSLAIEADISNENDCVRLIEEAHKAFGRIDVLVNSAGIQTDVPFEETTSAGSKVNRFHNFSAEILSGVAETTYGGTAALLSRT